LPTVTVGNPLGLRADPSAVDTLLRLAARQHSLLSRRQWLDGGLTQRQLDRAVANGGVLVIHPGVYAVRGSKASFERDVMAACLATGGVASHRCAAYLWKFRKFERPVIEVLVTKGHAPTVPGVTVRRTGRLDRAESTHVGPIPITTGARTLLDLVSVAPALVEGALDGALHQRRVALRTVGRTLERAGERHPGHRPLASLVSARLAGRRPTESELEDDLLAVIRRYGLPEPVPQYPYRGRRIDFAYPELVLGIEANSVQAHAAKEDVQRNAEKANDLVEWWVLYFTYDDVHGNPMQVARRIEEARAKRRAAPPVQPAA
jgi:very-short-patch-repair endonuclease